MLKHGNKHTHLMTLSGRDTGTVPSAGQAQKRYGSAGLPRVSVLQCEETSTVRIKRKCDKRVMERL